MELVNAPNDGGEEGRFLSRPPEPPQLSRSSKRLCRVASRESRWVLGEAEHGVVETDRLCGVTRSPTKPEKTGGDPDDKGRFAGADRLPNTGFKATGLILGT